MPKPVSTLIVLLLIAIAVTAALPLGGCLAGTMATAGPTAPAPATPPPQASTPTPVGPTESPTGGPASLQTQDDFALPPGFRASVFYSGLQQPTSIAFGPGEDLYVATRGDRSVHAIADQDGDGTGDSDRVFAGGLNEPLGIAFRDSLLYVSTRGEVSILRDGDGNGVADQREVIISGLPNGRHQNNGLAFGPDGKLYLTNGSATDVGPERSVLSATVLRANPDGSNLEVFARGLRNPYDIAFNRFGDLFATDNGPDAVPGPDELNHLVEGGDYGYPRVFGDPPGDSETIGPVANLGSRTAATGIVFYEDTQFPEDYRDNAFVTLWNAAGGGALRGREVLRVQLQRDEGRYRGTVTEFMTGLQNPIDVTVAPDGSLMVADFGSGTIYRVIYEPQTGAVPNTGSAISGRFQRFWQENGGLRIFGFPITGETEEDGAVVQYFERARFEHHPGAPEGAVSLGLLGRQVTTGRENEPAFRPVQPFPSGQEHRFFPETGHSLAYGFRHFWEANGDVRIFGYPISEELSERSPVDGEVRTVQYFERARFEYHPEFKGADFEVMLGLLGREILAADSRS